MSDIVEISVLLMRKYAEFTKRLTPEQLHGVANGELKLTLEGAARKGGTKAAPNFAEISERLDQIATREAATTYLDGLKLTGDQLKQLAKAVGASLAGVSKVGQFRDRIVEYTVGYRLNSSTLGKGGWS
jgi:hypothetical protein